MCSGVSTTAKTVLITYDSRGNDIVGTEDAFDALTTANIKEEKVSVAQI